jgi:hypothetical protein
MLKKLDRYIFLAELMASRDVAGNRRVEKIRDRFIF